MDAAFEKNLTSSSRVSATCSSIAPRSLALARQPDRHPTHDLCNYNVLGVAWLKEGSEEFSGQTGPLERCNEPDVIWSNTGLSLALHKITVSKFFKSRLRERETERGKIGGQEDN